MPGKKGGHVSTPKTYARSTKKAPVKKKSSTTQKAASAAEAARRHIDSPREAQPKGTSLSAEEYRRRTQQIRNMDTGGPRENRGVTSAEDYARRAAAKKAQQSGTRKTAEFVGRRAAPNAARALARTLSSAASAGYQLGTTPNASPAQVDRQLSTANRRLAGSGYKIIRTEKGGYKAVATRTMKTSGKRKKT